LGDWRQPRVGSRLPGDRKRALVAVAERATLDDPHARYPSGLYRTPAGTLHVSPGLGTTLVPFRFFARPEATELVLRARS